MMKNLHSLIDSVEEEMVESKKGRRQPQQTFKMLPTLPAFPVLNHCALHPLLPHTFHHSYSPESHPYPHIAYLTLPQFLLPPEANHHALTWIVTLLIVHVLLTFIPFITHVLTSCNPQQYACQMYLPYSFVDQGIFGYSLYIPYPHYSHPRRLFVVPIHLMFASPLFLHMHQHSTPSLPICPCPHQQHWNPLFLCQLLCELPQHLQYEVQPVKLEDIFDNIGKI